MKRGFTYLLATLLLLPLSAQTASLTPSVLEVSTTRGEVLARTFTIINASSREKTYFLDVMKFEPTEDGVGPKFIPFDEDHAGLPEWIVLAMSEVRVPANSKGDVLFEIAVPSDVASGGYYGAITVSESPADLVASNGAIVEAKTAILLLLTVEGETVEALELLDFSDHGSPLRASLSESFSYRVQNQGNVHVMPVGSVTIKDVFGRTIVVYDANLQKSRVLPGSTRVYEIDRPVATEGFVSAINRQMKDIAIGPMTVELSLSYGEAQTSIQASSGFWYVPWQLLATVVVLIVVLLLAFTRKRKS